MPTTSAANPIVSFDGVRADVGGRYDAGLEDASLSLHPGELAIVYVDPEHPRTPIADLLSGIVEPARGGVRYGGVAWRDRSAQDACRVRGRIGRVFEGGGWVNNISVADNVTLASRHHGTHDEHGAYEDAAEWACRFDLPGLPVRPVHQTLQRDLRRAACVRAFMGERDLLVLERPTRGVFAELMPQLVNAVRNARAKDCAVVWITSDETVFNSRSIRPTVRMRMYGNRLTPLAESAP